jgi:DNA-3-methyladenine glycosylase
MAGSPNPLPPAFFARKTVAVARDLVGCVLARRVGRRVVRSPIAETEAYVGPHDLACHAAKGRTRRTEAMYAEPGRLYVYFVYGVHWMLNVVTEAEGYPAAVLIRGVEGTMGPGRLTAALGITGTLNAKMCAPASGLWIEPRPAVVPPREIVRGPRIGVAYAGPVWSAKPYRFTRAAAKRSPRK